MLIWEEEEDDVVEEEELCCRCALAGLDADLDDMELFRDDGIGCCAGQATEVSVRDDSEDIVALFPCLGVKLS